MGKQEKKKSSMSFSMFDMFGSPVSFNIDGDESYRTVIGCVWTLIMVISVVVTFGYYAYVFNNHTEMTVTSQILVEDEFPLIDFKKSGFIFSVYGTKGKRILGPDVLGTFLSFEAFQFEVNSTKVDGERSEPVITSTRIPFTKCSSGGVAPNIGGQPLIGKISMALSDISMCSLPSATSDTDKMYVDGNDDSDMFAYVTLRVNPCDDSRDTCLNYYLETTETNKVSVRDTFKLRFAVYVLPLPIRTGSTFTAQEFVSFVESQIRSLVKDTYLNFNYVEATLDSSNYTNPLQYSMKSIIKTHTSIDTIKYVHVYFRELEVDTDVGWLWETLNSTSSIGFDLALSDTADRGMTDKVSEIRPGQATAEEIPTPYIEYQLLSSNNKLVYTRTYMKIIDLFSNVGGCAQVIIFIVIFCYAWYNSIRMEQSLLNRGVLGINDENEHQENWEKTRVFTFFDLIKFGFINKGICCCLRKDKKYKLYMKCNDAYEERTNVIAIMKSISDISNIKEAVFQPHQIKLLNYLGVDESEEDLRQLESQSGLTSKDLSVHEAVQILKQQSRKKNIIQAALDEYLEKHLPKDILDGTTDQLPVKKIHKGQVFNFPSKMQESAIDVIDLDKDERDQKNKSGNIQDDISGEDKQIIRDRQI